MRMFMSGRYGTDELSYAMTFTSLIFLLLSTFFRRLRFLYLIALVLLFLSWFRTLSKNIYKRQNEREQYLEFRDTIKKAIRVRRDMFRDRKTHKYYRCPNCRNYVRIPKPAKGKTIIVTCARCHTEFTKRT